MLRSERAVRLRLEPAVEVAAVEEPRERIGLRESLQGLPLLLHHEDLPDVPGQELERLEVGIVEGLAVVTVGHAQHASRVVADQDRHADKGIGAVGALARLDRRARHVTHQQRTLRLRDEAHDTLARLDPHLPHHIVREADRTGDHEVGGVLLA